MEHLTPYNFKVKVLTPVHVGMGQEKTYQYGVDYIWNPSEKKYWFIQSSIFLKSLSNDWLPIYSKALVENRTQEITDIVIKLCPENAIILKKSMKSGIREEVKRTYQDGNGKFYIPGSSIKGSLRSIFLKSIMGNQKIELKPKEKPEDIIFGKIDNNLMKLIQVCDLHFDNPKTTVFPTKIFSAYQNGIHGKITKGMWKHARNAGHTEMFEPPARESGFISYYECIQTNQDGNLRISVPSKVNERIKREWQTTIKNYSKNSIFNSPEHLIQTIKEHSRAYLQKEIEYFKRFENKYSEAIIKTYTNIYNWNEKEGKAILRVGAGSGYHAITGDWQEISKDHFTAWNDEKHYIKNKTRKFIFTEPTNPDDDVKFVPMGFLLISL